MTAASATVFSGSSRSTRCWSPEPDHSCQRRTHVPLILYSWGRLSSFASLRRSVLVEDLPAVERAFAESIGRPGARVRIEFRSRVAKALQRGPCATVVFDAEVRRNAQTRLATENDLRRALQQDELLAYYQPVVASK